MNKYGARKSKCMVCKRNLASALEASVCALLHGQEQAGKIKIMNWQVRVCLQPKPGAIYMIPDFKILNLLNHQEEYVEAKGMDTQVWRLKRRLWMNNGPGILHVYKGTWKNPKLHETIIPKCSP